jgi:Flp pilus assembly protein TadG
MRFKPARRPKGTAAVELAVSIMPLMIIVMGIFESGRLMMVEEQIVNAAREGARLAALGGSTIGSSTGTGPYEVSYRVRQYLAAAQISTGVSVAVTDLDNSDATDLPQSSAGDRIQVAVTVPFKNVAWCPPWFFGGATLSGTCIMRKEAP